MAEGGYDDPEFGDYDKDDTYYDDDVDIDDRLLMVPDDSMQGKITRKTLEFDKLETEFKKEAHKKLKQSFVDTFYFEVRKRYGIKYRLIDYNQFRLSDDGKTLFWVVGDKEEIRMTALKGKTEFLSLGTLASEYNKVVGKGGVQAIRQYLNLPEYNSKTKPLSKQARQALESTRNDLVNVEEQIPLQDFSSATELQFDK